MRLSLFRSLAPGLIPLLAFAVFAAGCSTTRPGAGAAPTPIPDENAAFTVEATPLQVLDAATVTLVNHNFTITLANERIGLVQTDYIPLSSLQAARRDTLGLRLDALQMRVTVTMQQRADAAQIVQVKGSFQRVGSSTGADDLVARYWVERVTQELAASLGVSFRPHITDATYAQAVQEAAAARADDRPSFTDNNAVRAVAIVVVLLFGLTLLTGVLSPGAASATP